ncbi:MAG: CPBP family intramembrane glutamic endopeptidase [Balneolaceae bacterium]|nr:CPBP family intramembrane glutamic endopeptidase [Balneolaceae bacterium]
MADTPEYHFEETPQPAAPIQSWAERNGFADWALALIWIIVAFILFQFAAVFVTVILFFATEGVQPDTTPNEVMNALLDHLDLLFIGNSFGQIVFLGLATWLFSRLHTTRDRHSQFLRFKTHSDTPKQLGLTAVLIIAAQPVIWFLSWVNVQLPVPEFFEYLQTSQLEMIENYLKSDHVMIITLFHIGLVPAVCEEILYRGYVMRAFERSWGIWVAIVASGFLFGLYHLQLTNLLPLASIGILLAFVTYVSDSIYPAILAHLINNGGSVIVASYYPDSSVAEITPESMPPLWALAVGTILTGYLIFYMYQQMNQQRGATSDV